MTQDNLLEFAERVERARGLLVGEATAKLILEAHALVDPAPRPMRVPAMDDGSPWPGDGLGPYTEEYAAWSRRADQLRRYLAAGASLDAAMTLVPEGWTGIIPVSGGDYAWLWPEGGDSKGHRVNAATPALALTAAALRARAALSRKEEGR